MNADVQLRSLPSELDGMIKRGSRCHQGCGGEDSVPARIHDAFVNVAREAEIIGVDDQLFQNNESFTCRNFFGFARKSCMSRFIWRVAPFKLSYSCWFTKSCPMVP